MSQKKSSPKLSDVTRQANSARASKFSAVMIPTPPINRTEPPVVARPPEPVEEPVIQQPVVKQEQKKEAEKTQLTPVHPESTAAKAARTRKSGGLSIEDVVGPQPPSDPYPRQVRISESHHKLLRRIAFNHEKTMNHVLYNLLELLDQAYQREQSKGE
ncbi:hypothetical protein [Arundinibacter roseus]|uniref:DUF3408 domain-containing protein n=1 Tax=Arundinibacter roseus TaxID=2070510 RepID=A0A4R4JZT0_9BACT|nr:hypothetical protein [Arundinibacter roseus]TDB59521.1 hypothetical protein EZE20_22205 [Arundinibacter roseus]